MTQAQGQERCRVRFPKRTTEWMGIMMLLPSSSGLACSELLPRRKNKAVCECVLLASKRSEPTLSKQVLISSSVPFLSYQRRNVKLERQQGKKYREATHRTVMPPVALFVRVCQQDRNKIAKCKESA